MEAKNYVALNYISSSLYDENQGFLLIDNGDIASLMVYMHSSLLRGYI